MRGSLAIDARKSALVVIDLQQGIVSRSCAPYEASTVVARASAIARAMRAVGGLVILVHVASHDGKDLLRPEVDDPPPIRREVSGDWSAIVPQLGPEPTDLLITKRQWGAFYGTDLDLQLRRRGIQTVLLCGIATGMGVDTTGREAYQHGYQLVFLEDAMTGLSVQEHEHCIERIFPRLGKIRSSDEVLAALKIFKAYGEVDQTGHMPF